MATHVDVRVGGDTPLIAACRLGPDVETVRVLLRHGAEIDARGEDGRTALFCTADRGSTNLVKALLKAGAAVDVSATDGRTALVASASEGHAVVVKALLSAGASDVANGPTALMGAADNGITKIVKMLLSSGADVDARDPDGWTALMSAAAAGSRACAKALLDAGADVGARDARGQSARGLALQNGFDALARSFEKQGAASDDPLLEAVLAGDEARLGEVLASDPKLQAYDLAHLALEGASPRMFTMLLDAGVAVDRRRGADGQTELMRASSQGAEDAVHALIAAGADVHAQSLEDRSMFFSAGRTPLFYAVGGGSDECVVALLDAGARVDVVAADKSTVLVIAARKGARTTLEILLGRGAEPDQDDAGFTPLYQALTAGDMELAQWLVDRGAQVDAPIWTGATPLMAAAKEKCIDAMRWLRECGADIQAMDRDGKSALHHACEGGDFDVVELLLEWGSELEVRDGEGLTPLMHAVKRGHAGVVDAMIEGGADADAKTRDGQSLSELAAAEQRTDVVAMLAGDPVPLSHLPRADQEHFDVGRELFAAGDHSGALARFRSVSSKHQERVAVVAANTAYCHQQLGEHESAAAMFERARELEPRTAHVWRASCFSLCALGRWEEMERAAAGAVERSPQDDYSWQQLGIARVQLERYEDAVVALRKALELNEKNGYAAYTLAQALLESGEKDEAVRAFAQAFECAPELKEAARSDDDLSALRERPEFAALLRLSGDGVA